MTWNIKYVHKRTHVLSHTCNLSRIFKMVVQFSYWSLHISMSPSARILFIIFLIRLIYVDYKYLRRQMLPTFANLWIFKYLLWNSYEQVICCRNWVGRWLVPIVVDESSIRTGFAAMILFFLWMKSTCGLTAMMSRDFIILLIFHFTTWYVDRFTVCGIARWNDFSLHFVEVFLLSEMTRCI